MKNLKFLFVAVVLTCFVGITQSNAQADFYSDFRVDVWSNIDAGDETSVPAFVDARALVTPSGIIHLKAEYQLDEENPLVPMKGKMKIMVDVVRFRCDMNGTGTWMTNLYFEQTNVQGIVGSDGVVKIVTKALVEDGVQTW